MKVWLCCTVTPFLTITWTQDKIINITGIVVYLARSSIITLKIHTMSGKKRNVSGIQLRSLSKLRDHKIIDCSPYLWYQLWYLLFKSTGYINLDFVWPPKGSPFYPELSRFPRVSPKWVRPLRLFWAVLKHIVRLSAMLTQLKYGRRR